VLFQKRGHDKILFPNLLDISAAGHYQAGEPLEAGVREIVEEVGLDVRFEQLVPLGIKIDIGKYDDILNRELCHVFLLKEPRPVEDYKLDPGELDGLVEISLPDGFGLFTGKLKEVNCSGLERDPAANQWRQYRGVVSTDSFIPRLDPYYLKIFIMAQRLLRNEYPLAI
jgi:8-oxo-dGTP pyrophosphatase MutT (NUDIX family)